MRIHTRLVALVKNLTPSSIYSMLSMANVSVKIREFTMNNKGFTLIELLVVVAILSILGVISLYQYAVFRESAFCSRIESDVHNTITTLEGQYSNTFSYAGVSPVQTEDNGIVIVIDASADAVSSVEGSHPKCKKGIFKIDPAATPVYAWIP